MLRYFYNNGIGNTFKYKGYLVDLNQTFGTTVPSKVIVMRLRYLWKFDILAPPAPPHAFFPKVTADIKRDQFLGTFASSK